MNFDVEIKHLFGEKVVETLLSEVDKANINEDQAGEIARQLHPTVGGNFLRDRKRPGYCLDRQAFKKILSDWYKMSTGEEHKTGLDKLMRTLKSKDVHLK